jgi:endonuclease-3
MEKYVSDTVVVLSDTYPDAEISLNYSNNFELLVAVILSAQCTDERVNKVTENQKARWIVETAKNIIEIHGGNVPDNMGDLLNLPGVGRKTSNVVLQHGYGKIEGIVVDTHVMRLSRRMGFTEKQNRDAIERELMEIVPKNKWRMYTHLMISHGRAICKARRPECESCPLKNECPSSRNSYAIDLANGKKWLSK